MDAEKDVAIYRLKSRLSEYEDEIAKYKARSDASRKFEFRITGLILLIIGTVTLIAGYFLFEYASIGNVMVMAGIGSLFLGGVIVSLNTEKFMNQDVAEDLNLSSVIVLDDLLRDLQLRNKGIYIPSSKTSGITKIFVPLKKHYELPAAAKLKEEQAFLIGLPNALQEGVLLRPLGYHLFKYTTERLNVEWRESLDTTVSPDKAPSQEQIPITSLSKKLREVFVKGLDMAEDVTIASSDGGLQVRLHDTPYSSMCQSLMKEAPQVCGQIGCPICSLIACIYTEYADREVLIESTESTKQDISLVLKPI